MKGKNKHKTTLEKVNFLTFYSFGVHIHANFSDHLRVKAKNNSQKTKKSQVLLSMNINIWTHHLLIKSHPELHLNLQKKKKKMLCSYLHLNFYPNMNSHILS